MSWTCKIWQQKEFQNTWKSRQIMVKIGFNIILNTKHKNKKQEHKICKTKMKMKIWSNNIWKFEYEMKWTRLWCKIVLQVNVE
jgi:hypothetical protein